MTTTLDATTEPRRDRFGRYLIPDPDTGNERAWTRATTMADTIDDRYNLELWKLRTAAVGLATRKDLLALVAAHRGDKKALDRVCADALEAGKASEAANLGTALHALTEQLDRGADALILDDLRSDIEAYQRTMAASGLEIATLPDGRKAIECIVIVPELGVAGTFDRLYDPAHQRFPIIGDLKTGASAVTFALNSIAIQLSLYAHASHLFDPLTGKLTPMPVVDRSKAVVVHLPVGSGECALYEVDIAAGWEAAQLCAGVRKWRQRKDLATRIEGLGSPDGARAHKSSAISVDAGAPSPSQIVAGTDVEPEPSATEEAVELRRDETSSVPATTFIGTTAAWLVDRCKALAEQGHGAVLKAAWPQGAPPPKSAHEWTIDHEAAIEALLNNVERECMAQFPSAPPTPIRPEVVNGQIVGNAAGEALVVAEEAIRSKLGATELDEGPEVSFEQVQALAELVNNLKGDQAALMRKLGKEMAEAGYPLKLNCTPTERRYEIAQACFAWATKGDEKTLREALGLDANGSLGLALAWLSINEAKGLAAKAVTPSPPKKRTTKKKETTT